eukprot:jgi/Chlat1/5747/Chrsp38S05574
MAANPEPAADLRPLDAVGDSPGPRCGHSLSTAADSTGRPRLVLFGGATALEAKDLSQSGSIRLAGATTDVHVLDVRGFILLAMFLHRVLRMRLGGIGPNGLAPEDLYVLDLNCAGGRWHKVAASGRGPGSRYAHTLSLVNRRFVVCFGGHDGNTVLADLWVLDTATKPYQWTEVQPVGPLPCARMYATASARADGLLLLFGGRDASGVPLGDAYGLARHRDARWEWGVAPGSAPVPRFQHSAAFVGPRLHVQGGACTGNRLVMSAGHTAVLDTSIGAWANGSSSTAGRCRHAAASVEDEEFGCGVIVYGGLNAAGDLLMDTMWGDDQSVSAASSPDGDMQEAEPSPVADARLEAVAREEAEAARTIAMSAGMPLERPVTPPLPSEIASPASEGGTKTPVTSRGSVPGVRLHHRAVVIAADGGPLGSVIRQLSLDQFENEARRVSMGSQQSEGQDLARRSLGLDSPMLERLNSLQGVHKTVLHKLLEPRQWAPPPHRQFFLSAAQVDELCTAAERIMKDEPNVLKLRAPIKIFGDLHGQFGDLMRFFQEYGCPDTSGDIKYIDYLFLGDYVDRGAYSLETISLLLALKIEHPHTVHLIRGNHEEKSINKLFGFRTECVERMGETEGLEAWRRFNRLFNWLPLAALIEGKIMCMHGGVGRSIDRISQIEEIQRPLRMRDGGVQLMDLLWSDPTENDHVEGVQPNSRGAGLVSFGPDRVRHFCAVNDVQLIVRAHECVMDGFERFAQGHLITVFSATNYCGTANNAGAILVLGRDLVVVPKLIHPLPPAVRVTSPAVLPNSCARHTADIWMQDVNDERPPTPPRGRPLPVQ